jgi:ABC-type multidrug transport system ATPase subunit
MLKRLKEQGITILVSTPYMDEAALCDRIALIQNGKILTIDAPAAISASYPDKLYAVKANKMSSLLKALSSFRGAKTHYSFGEYAHVSIDNDQLMNNGEPEIIQDLKKHLQKEGLENIEIKPIKASIEDSFINLLK